MPYRSPASESARQALPSALGGYADKVFALDTRSLALLRIGVGLVAFLSTMLQWPDAHLNYGVSGVMPAEAMLGAWGKAHLWTLHLVFQAGWWVHFLFFAAAACALLVTVGIWWRWSGFLLWLLLVSMSHRNPLVQNSGDGLLCMLLLWSLFLPCAEHFTLQKNKRTGQPRMVVGFASAAIVLQFFYVYAVGALHKTGAAWRSDYTAVWDSLQLQSFSTPLGDWLAQFPDLCALLTIGVFWSELLVPVLLFVPYRVAWWRLLAVAYSFALHAGMGSALYLKLFPLVGLVLALPLLPPVFWSWLQGKCTKSSNGFRAEPRLERMRGAGEALSALLVILAAFSSLENVRNTGSLSRLGPYLPEALRPAWEEAGRFTSWFLRSVHLQQKWKMFSPHPQVNDAYFIVEGTTEAGQKISLYPGYERFPMSRNPVYARPITGYGGHVTLRWRTYFKNISQSKHASQRRYCAAFLARLWNQSAPFSEQVVRVRILKFSRNVAKGEQRGSEKEVVLLDRPVSELPEVHRSSPR